MTTDLYLFCCSRPTSSLLFIFCVHTSIGAAKGNKLLLIHYYHFQSSNVDKSIQTTFMQIYSTVLQGDILAQLRYIFMLHQPTHLLESKRTSKIWWSLYDQ